jgi:hypothetical protein
MYLSKERRGLKYRRAFFNFLPILDKVVEPN